MIVVIRRTITTLSESGLLEHSEALASAVLEGIKKRFNDFFKDEDILLESATHPKFKFNWLDDSNNEDKKLKDSTISNFRKRILAQQEKGSNVIQPAKLLSPEDPKDFLRH